jgi:hypothetical protein
MRAKLLHFDVGVGYHELATQQNNPQQFLQEDICQLELINGYLIAVHDQNIVPYLQNGYFNYQEVIK